jgi:hypothetical protein
MKKYIKTDKCKNSNFIVVKTFYHKGGINYFTYKNEKRGIYLSFQPVMVEDCDGYKCERFEGFSGIKFFIKELNRKSDKQITLVDSKIENVVNELCRLFEDKKMNELSNLIYSLV